MVLKIGRDLYPVGSLAEASALYSEMRDDSGEGYSTWPEGQIVGTDLRVSYNGKIFKGKWVQGQKPVYDPYGPALEGSNTSDPRSAQQREKLATWANKMGQASRHRGAPRLTPDATRNQLLAWHWWNDSNFERDPEELQDTTAEDLWDMLQSYYDDDNHESAPAPAGRSRSAPRRIIPWISTAEEQRAAAAGDEDTLNRWWQVKSAPRHDQAAWWRYELEELLAEVGVDFPSGPLPREVHPLLPDISELVDPDVVEVAIKGPKHNRWSEYVEDGSISTLVEELLEQALNASDSQIMQYAEEFYEGTL